MRITVRPTTVHPVGFTSPNCNVGQSVVGKIPTHVLVVVFVRQWVRVLGFNKIVLFHPGHKNDDITSVRVLNRTTDHMTDPMYPMTHLVQDINGLKQQIDQRETELLKLNKLLTIRQAELRQACGSSLSGHQYEVQYDDDYHTFTKYYVCKICDDFTRHKP
jgi:hypothetical protein